MLLFHVARSSRGEYRPIARRLVREGYNCLALDARPDLERAIPWARELGFEGRLAIWGSSYSAALAMFVGADEAVDAVLAFSPGDYLPPKGSTPEAAAKLSKPVLVVCPPDEETQARALFERIASEHKSLFVHEGGLHGSRTLHVAPDPAAAWTRVLAFLEANLL